MSQFPTLVILFIIIIIIIIIIILRSWTNANFLNIPKCLIVCEKIQQRIDLGLAVSDIVILIVLNTMFHAPMGRFKLEK